MTHEPTRDRPTHQLPATVKQEVDLTRALLTLMARRRDVSITLSRNFTTEEFLNALLQLEIHPAQFFQELEVLEQADDGQLKAALSRLLDSGVDLDRAIEILLPQLPEVED